MLCMVNFGKIIMLVVWWHHLGAWFLLWRVNKFRTAMGLSKTLSKRYNLWHHAAIKSGGWLPMFQRHTLLPSSETTFRISHSNHHPQNLWHSEVSQQLWSNQPNELMGSHHTMAEFKIRISCVIVLKHQNECLILENVKTTKYFHIITTYFIWISHTRNFQKIRQ